MSLVKARLKTTSWIRWVEERPRFSSEVPVRPLTPVSCLSRPGLPGDGNEKRQHADSSRASEWDPPPLLLLSSPSRSPPGVTNGT